MPHSAPHTTAITAPSPAPPARKIQKRSGHAMRRSHPPKMVHRVQHLSRKCPIESVKRLQQQIKLRSVIKALSALAGGVYWKLASCTSGVWTCSDSTLVISTSKTPACCRSWPTATGRESYPQSFRLPTAQDEATPKASNFRLLQLKPPPKPPTSDCYR